MNLRRAFTLIELLAVVAIVGLLAALIFPSLGAARKSADRARTRVQFSQWTVAIESFRREYGHYPTFDPSNLVNGGASTSSADDHLFHDVLAGRKRDGTPLSTASSASAGRQNPRHLVFHSFGESDFTPPGDPSPNLLRNAFGNLSIAVLVDRNLDGRIDSEDYASFPAVLLPDGSVVRPTSGGADTDIPANGLRTAVAFYCADPNATAAAPQFVFSWK